MTFSGPNLARYEISLCKRCFGCQRMEQDNFIPQLKCNQAILVAENEQLQMEILKSQKHLIRTSTNQKNSYNMQDY